MTIYNAYIFNELFLYFSDTIDFKHILVKSRTLNSLSDDRVQQKGYFAALCIVTFCLAFRL